MKKLINSILIIISLFLIVNVNADTNNIVVTNVTVKDKSDTITVNTPVLSSNEITSNITFNEENDYVELELTLKNNEEDSYKIESIKDNNTSDRITIDYDYEDKFIKSGDTSKILIKLSYVDKLVNVDNINLNDLEITLNLIKEDGTTSELLINPKTSDNILKYLILLIITITGLILIKNKKKMGKVLLIISIVLIPFTIVAEEKYEVKIKFNNIVLKSEYEVYNVTINLGNNTNPIVREITYGDTIGHLPEPPVVTGHTFSKWVDQDENEVTEETIVTNSLTITPIYTTDSHDLTITRPEYINEGDLSGEYEYGEEITLTAKTREGYTFTKWSNNETTNPLTITMGTSDISIEPIYTQNSYTVLFDTDGGPNIPSQNVNHGQKATRPSVDPTKNGYTFDDWYIDNYSYTKFDFNTPITSNTTIYAYYYRAVQNATIDPTSIEMLDDETTYISVSNVDESYSFDTNDSSVADVSSSGTVFGRGEGTTTITITGDRSGTTKTIHVKVRPATYTITLEANGGELSEESMTVHRGDSIGDIPTPTAPEGMVFDGWYTGMTDGVEVTSSYTPDGDITIYAHYIDPCKTFSTDSWNTIKNNIEDDSNYYAVGCEKEVEIDMDNDNTKESYTVRLANTSTPDVCNTDGYSQTACGKVIEFVDVVTTRKMNSSNTNAGGWDATEMRTYLNGEFYNKLPTTLKSAIIETDPVVSGSGSGGLSPNTNDNIYLLSTREAGFNASYDNKRNINTDTRVLDYYSTHNSNQYRVKKDLNNNASTWWLRSAGSSLGTYFYFVSTDSNSSITNAYKACGVAPAFRIAE